MVAPAQPQLTPGRVYRTAELRSWGRNSHRLAKRLVRNGELVQLAPGLFLHPKQSRFGAAPPSDSELMRAFLKGGPFVFTGPEHWNALGLGSTAMHAVPLVYNTKRSGLFTLGGRRFRLRRVAFPHEGARGEVSVPREWYVVDLFENSAQTGVSLDTLERGLMRALELHELDPARLLDMARVYGTQETEARLLQVVGVVAP